MGLTIHYKLSVEKNISSAAARELIQRVALYAKEIGCAEVGKVERVKPDDPFSSLFVRVGREEDCCFGNVPARAGWMVEVWPGEGCESAEFALCKYPRRIRFRAGSVATGYEDGWLFKGHCKTQYAAEHGWPHFLHCHKTVVSLLDFWRQLGATVEVTDEGNFYESRSDEKLRAVLEKYDGLVAAVAGVLKDAAHENGKSVESPIFERADFEHLEAAGQREFKEQLSQLSRTRLGRL